MLGNDSEATHAATMEKLSFKVYLMHDLEQEVRRFGMEQSEFQAASYPKLREKLQTLFPELRDRNFTISWKGELVVFFFSSLSLAGERRMRTRWRCQLFELNKRVEEMIDDVYNDSSKT